MADNDRSLAATLDPPATPGALPAKGSDDPVVSILGVEVTNVTRQRAVALLEEMIRHGRGTMRSIFFVNAHTLNWAAADPSYREVLNSADYVFGDGTGVRWAARLQGVRMQDNVNGTDLTPELFRATAGRGYRYFLLGADRESIRRAAEHARKTLTGWIQAGFHHGYVNDPGRTSEVIRQINRARPHLLLVAMGNPIQERWIHDHRHQLEVPLGMAVGGLFSYWAGNIRRSPRWLRRCGLEWLGILLQQPRKARRYLAGNPKFLLRAVGDAWVRRGHRKNRQPAKTSP